MNTKSILIAFLSVLTFQLSAQKIKFLNTKDLIRISNSYGLDYALYRFDYEKGSTIDTATTKELLIRCITENINSNRKINFVSQYCKFQNFKIQSTIINEYIKRSTKLVDDYVVKKYNERLPKVRNTELLTTQIDTEREGLLIDYYNAWSEKSKAFKDEYLRGVAAIKSPFSLYYIFNIKKLYYYVNLYTISDTNAYEILSALKAIDSEFATEEKIKEHLKTWGAIKIETKKTPKANIDVIAEKKFHSVEEVNLSKDYNSIAEINFSAEPTLQKLFTPYLGPKGSFSIIYNQNIGYLDVGYYLGFLSASGTEYKIELINKNILRIYLITRWMS